MTVAKSKRVANDKWDRENMITLGCKVKREEADAFKQFAATQEKTSNTVLKEFVQSCIAEETTAIKEIQSTTPQTTPPNQFTLPLTQEELEQLDRHCLFSLCKKPDFIHEAITEKLLRESPPQVPTKKESLPAKGKPTMIVTQTDDDLTEEIPTLLKTIRDGQKTSSKNTLTQMVAGQIITDKMNNLRSENRTEEYIALTNLFATTPKNKADFMEEVKNANFMSDVDEAINALLIFHGLKDGETV